MGVPNDRQNSLTMTNRQRFIIRPHIIGERFWGLHFLRQVHESYRGTTREYFVNVFGFGDDLNIEEKRILSSLFSVFFGLFALLLELQGDGTGRASFFQFRTSAILVQSYWSTLQSHLRHYLGLFQLELLDDL